MTQEWSHQLPRKSRHYAGLHASFDQPRHLASRLLDRYGERQLADVDALDDVRLDVAGQDIRDGNALAPELDARRVDDDGVDSAEAGEQVLEDWCDARDLADVQRRQFDAGSNTY